LRLDRYLSKYAGLSRKSILQYLHQSAIEIDGITAHSREQQVSNFSVIRINGQKVESHKPALYFMLNKPAGILSATTDPEHPTAVELMPEEIRHDLHISGRLDRATTGLLILTNDGKWSRYLTEPQKKIPKVYLVNTVYAISPETPDRFSKGIYFGYEDLTTSPAQTEIIDSHQCRLTIYEGRYHQVKRMFAAVGNRVEKLHRESMGDIKLDKTLQPGEFRVLHQAEVDAIKNHQAW